MKKLSLFLVAVMLTTTLFAGCQKAAKEDGNATAATTTASKTSGSESSQKADDFSERLPLLWYLCCDATAYKENSVVAKKLGEKFNVDINTVPINGFDNDKMNATLASGTIPDVLIRWGTHGYYKDGLIQPIEKQMIETYMPNTYAAIEKYGKPAWAMVTSSTDGKIMGIPQITVTGDNVISMAIRQDWLNNVGLKEPKTIDELTEVLRKFTKDDPDKNNKKDTFGITAPGMHNNPMFATFTSIFGAYGIIPNVWNFDENGQVSFGAVQNGYKDALKQLNAWYKEGLIDPEFVTTDNATFSTKVKSGLTGVWDCVSPGYLDPISPTGTVAMTKANDPNAEWTFIAPVKGPKGKSGGATYGAVGSWTMSFGAKASKKQIIRSMQIAEAINSDKELFELVSMGIEGTTFEKANGFDVPIKGVNLAEYGANVFRTGSVINWENASLVTVPSVIELIKKSLEFPTIRNVVSTGSIGSDCDETKIDGAEMNKLCLEFFFNAITGKVNVDTEWDAYVEKWMKLGGKLLTESARKAEVIYK